MLYKLATLLFLCSAAVTAGAEQVTLGGRTLNIPTPAGYCVAGATKDEKEGFDRIAFGMGADNKLLFYFVECKELARVRDGSAGYRGGYNSYVTVAATAPKGVIYVHDEVTRQQYVQLLAKGMGKGIAAEEGIERAMKRVRQFGAGDQAVQNFGVVGVDESAAYVSVVTVGAAQDGSRGLDYVMTVGGPTIIKGVRLGYTAVWLRKSPDELPEMLKQLKAVSASLVASNK
ncbi:hypothetical protein [Variovorax sp. YR566]|uniref:hypothetical protein n=1 Tax=Variovorax sp. YR566 TaxID=3450237 RepID=UPI003F7EA0A9